jgi:hypothetical protein
MSEPLRVPAEEVTVADEVDLAVVGGGSAGVAAAVVAAQRGLRVALVEEMPFLGGMSTGGAVGTYCGFFLKRRDGTIESNVGGFPLQIAETLKARGHAYGPIPFKETAALPYVPWGVKLLLEERVAALPNLRLWLHAKATHAVVATGTIRGIAIATSPRATPTSMRSATNSPHGRPAVMATLLLWGRSCRVAFVAFKNVPKATRSLCCAAWRRHCARSARRSGRPRRRWSSSGCSTSARA